MTVPGDKSISHRALMLGAVADARTSVSGFLPGDDCLATLRALAAMGVTVERRAESEIDIDGAGPGGLRAPAGPLDLGNSGTAMRLFAGLLCGQPFESTLTGDRSLSLRPMQRVIDPLARMGAKIESRNGKPPLQLNGGRRLTAIEYALPVASAQVKSAILLAGLQAEGTTTITEPAVTRDHTERMLRSMGADLEIDGSRIVLPGPQALRATDIAVPADLSSAAFVIVATLISHGSEVLLRNVGVNPTRTGALEILRQMGADIGLHDERVLGLEPVADISVRPSALRGIDVDPQFVPLAIDEFPALFVAAAFAEGATRFSGVGELRVKESDRISAMAAGLESLGVRVEETADGATVHGGHVTGGDVSSRGDHRIAMAFAVAGSAAQGRVCVHDTGPVDTSFPGFVGCLRALGVDVEVGCDDAGR